MKDILFLIPVYYTPHFIDRFQQYLVESKTSRSYDVYVCCSNHAIAEETKKKAQKYGFIFQERENFGGGEGALWFLQKKSGIDVSSYRYFWYFEESCEPIRNSWVDKLVGDLDKGACLVGWDWNPTGKRRPGQIKHVFQDGKGNKMTACENTPQSGQDTAGNPFNKIWDTPGYRDETFVIRAADFTEFDYPDASDDFWEKRYGSVRGYGVRAERMWWNINEQNIHGIKYPSPNIQWYILRKYNYVPPAKNVYFWYFRELPIELRKSDSYAPKKIAARYLQNIISIIFNKIRNRFFRGA